MSSAQTGFQARMKRVCWTGVTRPRVCESSVTHSEGRVGSQLQEAPHGGHTQVGRSDVQSRSKIKVTAGGVHLCTERSKVKHTLSSTCKLLRNKKEETAVQEPTPQNAAKREKDEQDDVFWIYTCDEVHTGKQ